VLFVFAGGLVAAIAAHYGRKPALARARMARALATAVEAGLTLPRAIRLAADASADAEIRQHVMKQSEKQLASRSIIASLDGCPHLTPDFVGYLQTAEKTGDFTPLSRLAELYEDGFR
jgi:type II secretory pathway component PulF